MPVDTRRIIQFAVEFQVGPHLLEQVQGVGIHVTYKALQRLLGPPQEDSAIEYGLKLHSLCWQDDKNLTDCFARFEEVFRGYNTYAGDFNNRQKALCLVGAVCKKIPALNAVLIEKWQGDWAHMTDDEVYSDVKLFLITRCKDRVMEPTNNTNIHQKDQKDQKDQDDSDRTDLPISDTVNICFNEHDFRSHQHDSWLFNIAADEHIVNNTKWFLPNTVRQVEKRILACGSSVATNTAGSVALPLMAPDGKKHVLGITNVFLVPSVPMNILSGVRFYGKGNHMAGTTLFNQKGKAITQFDIKKSGFLLHLYDSPPK